MVMSGLDQPLLRAARRPQRLPPLPESGGPLNRAGIVTVAGIATPAIVVNSRRIEAVFGPRRFRRHAHGQQGERGDFVRYAE